VARWATSASIPVDFVKAVSIEELRARLRSGRVVSAVLIDGTLAALDRDLCDLAREVGAAVIIVDDGRLTHSWTDLGASGVVARELTRAQLMEVLERAATPVARVDDLPPLEATNVDASWHGRLVAVTGPGGTGASTIAMAAAQGLGRDVRFATGVLLADLSLDADLAMLHDAEDVVPGVLELVEAHRAGRVAPEQVRSFTFEIPERGYDLLLGLRRHRDWTAVRPRAFEAALLALRRTYRVVVADIDRDVEGESECGSLDVEERNTFARVVARDADVVLVVGDDTIKGVHSLVRTIRGLLRVGTQPARLMPVINRSARGPRARADTARAVNDLVSRAPIAPLLHVGPRRRLDDAMRDAAPLPTALCQPVGAAVQAMLTRTPGPDHDRAPVKVAPGTLGSFELDPRADEALA
jgi:hypothetical protein